ncbi:MAG: winged helix-turn-helix domain-containing protein [Pseudolabrys sp.]|nr:winged helix-turn-helix domain-containing protein [Pseudolabrys sp.]
MLRFKGFELNSERAELRREDGQIIKLRPKTFAALHMMATNRGRILTKQELMTAIWPNIHVGEDSLFQCIREIRAALGDEKRQLVKSVSGRGYMFDAEVMTDAPPASPDAVLPPSVPPLPVPTPDPAGWRSRWRPSLILAAVGVCGALGIAVAAPMIARRFQVPDTRAMTVMPIEIRTPDPVTAAMAANVTDQLTDGLSKIRNIRVLAPPRVPAGATEASVSSSPATPDFVVRGDLQRGQTEWEIRARLIESSTGQVQWSGSFTVPFTSLDERLQQTRLTAGIGNPLALRINALTHANISSPESKIVVEQAAAFINQTNRERFAAAQEMLEKAHAAKPDDVDISAALAAHLIRGVQIVWYPPAQTEVIEQRAKTMLDKAVSKESNYIPVLQGYCRFLQTINEFSETLVACENALRFDPWDGLTMFQLGMAQLRLGRFEDALSTFQRADAGDTPQVSRWTWLLGAGLTLMCLERYEDALPWLERSLAITPGSGRTQMMIAASYEALGRHDEARAIVAKALQLRPGTTGENVGLPPKNQSPRYLKRANEIVDLLVAAGLPPK